ncbi:MAG TPA: hypothetical protein VN420_02650 [Candidatus Fimivivens sp.]|nr:hypothetical protein [Candidatus Fimivivens sp.]
MIVQSQFVFPKGAIVNQPQHVHSSVSVLTHLLLLHVSAAVKTVTIVLEAVQALFGGTNSIPGNRRIEHGNPNDLLD